VVLWMLLVALAEFLFLGAALWAFRRQQAVVPGRG